MQPEGSGAAIRAATDGAREALILTRGLVSWGAAGVYKKRPLPRAREHGTQNGRVGTAGLRGATNKA